MQGRHSRHVSPSPGPHARESSPKVPCTCSPGPSAPLIQKPPPSTCPPVHLSHPPGPPQSHSRTSIEDDRFSYRCLQAVKLTKATQHAITDKESHLLSRIREEEFILEMLHEEVEQTSSRKKTATYQLESIREGVESYGVKLPNDAEVEASVCRPPPEFPQSPGTPTKTPPGQVFQHLLEEILNCPSSDGTTAESSYVSSSLMSPVLQPSSVHKIQSPALEALTRLPQLAPTDQILSQITPPLSTFPTLPEVDARNVLTEGEE
jgi:hypothetical protein